MQCFFVFFFSVFGAYRVNVNDVRRRSFETNTYIVIAGVAVMEYFGRRYEVDSYSG